MDQAIERIAGAAAYILPEIILVATVCTHFLAGPFLVSPSGIAPAGLRHRWGWLALIGLSAAAGIWFSGSVPFSEGRPLGPFVNEDLTVLIRGFSFTVGFVLLLLNWNQVSDAEAAEYHGYLLLIVAGINLVAVSNDLVGMFLALELVSLPTYVALYLGKHDAKGQEAVIKYFLISVFSSAVMLFGFSYLFGVTGTTNLTSLHAAIAGGTAEPIPAILQIAVIMVVAGLAFRITAVPFHFYAPDVFQGTAGTGAALLAIVPKIAGFVALIRLLFTPEWIEVPGNALWSLATQAAPILWVVSALSILVGNMVALQQMDLRRLLAWSSIAHAGYMLVGLTTASGAGRGGLEALLFYLAAYAAMTVGAFAVLIALERRGKQAETIDDLSGLSRSHPLAALAMTLFLLSLIGLPPTAGFLGKLNLLLAAWSQETANPYLPDARWLAGILVVGAAIGARYYLRVIGVMYLGEVHEEVGKADAPRDVPAVIGVACCALVTIALFAAPSFLWPIIQRLGS